MKIIVVTTLALIIFAFLIWALSVSCPIMDSKENWVNYEELPYGNIRSGAGDPNIRPMAFYNNPIYRRPLNWPICHLVDYPVPHCRSDSL
jgi:hypothetical protein